MSSQIWALKLPPYQAGDCRVLLKIALTSQAFFLWRHCEADVIEMKLADNKNGVNKYGQSIDQMSAWIKKIQCARRLLRDFPNKNWKQELNWNNGWIGLYERSPYSRRHK